MAWTCKCKCRLDASVCNNKEGWNADKFMCECKKLIDESVCDKQFIWNLSNCKWECDKSCDIGKYLHYINCKCRKKLVEECIKSIDEVEITEITRAENKCSSCTLHIVLFLIFFTFSIWIATYFVYYKCMSCNKENVSKYNYTYQAKNYQCKCKWKKLKK